MPRALAADPAWLSVLAFALGGIAPAHVWPIVFGVAVDLFSDGLTIGTGSGISPNLGLLLSLGQISAIGSYGAVQRSSASPCWPLLPAP